MRPAVAFEVLKPRTAVQCWAFAYSQADDNAAAVATLLHVTGGSHVLMHKFLTYQQRCLTKGSSMIHVVTDM